jgi:hypothetical protein
MYFIGCQKLERYMPTLAALKAILFRFFFEKSLQESKTRSTFASAFESKGTQMTSSRAVCK